MVEHTPPSGGAIAQPAAAPTDVVRVAIPSGLWLRAAGGRPVAADDPAFQLVLDDNRFTLLIGEPGGSTPTAIQVSAVVRTLGPADRARLVLTVYGAEPAAYVSLAQQVADQLGTPVRACHGLFLTDAQDAVQLTAVDATGRPSWSPFARLSRYRPAGVGADVEDWWTPFQGPSAAGPDWYRLTAAWTIDVIPAGMLVRPADATANPLLRCAPTDPGRVDLVVDVPDGERLPDDMLSSLARFADALPLAARSRLRVVLTPAVPPVSAQTLARAVPAPQYTWFPPNPR